MRRKMTTVRPASMSPFGPLYDIQFQTKHTADDGTQLLFQIEMRISEKEANDYGERVARIREQFLNGYEGTTNQ